MTSLAEKSAIQIGHAVWIAQNCIVNTDKVSCGNCARHCPTGAIQMIPKDENDESSPKIPVVNTERCIGCGTSVQCHLCGRTRNASCYLNEIKNG